jgi:hypothetical protein
MVERYAFLLHPTSYAADGALHLMANLAHECACSVVIILRLGLG